ncbi:MAG: flagellar basal body P-ring protein FlgI [Fibrobacterota bacterium]
MLKKNIKSGTLILALFISFTVHSARIKDVASVNGLVDMQLWGYGLVVGLDGSGDGPRTMFTARSIANMLANEGLFVKDRRFKVKNVAAVMVTATMVPFKKKGSRMDVTVSSIGDAKSLEGGTLLLTPLKGIDGEIYSTAQGAISVGGYSQGTAYRDRTRKELHVNVAGIPDGAIVQKEIYSNEFEGDAVTLSLRNPDFSSAVAMMRTINLSFNENIARVKDAANVSVSIPDEFMNGYRVAEFLARLEVLSFDMDMKSRIVINERTGTIVAGGDISISRVAISHGALTLEVVAEAPAGGEEGEEGEEAPAAAPASSSGGREKEEPARMVVLQESTNVSELADALTALQVPPRDIISIFQAIKRAGALQADLVIM